jgi:transaldolase
MNRVKEINKYGQSIWLDYIRRQMLENGELKKLIKEDGIRGVTSNPSIFEKAIAGNEDYDGSLASFLVSEPDLGVEELFERLAVADIRQAADILRPVYDRTEGGDGYVSMEVSPHLAHDRERTLVRVRHLWRLIDRPNLMIKVPATREGVSAFEELTAEGININVTLMFSLAHYDAVADAYIAGLECCPDPTPVASVASFFISRIDTAVDRKLDGIGTPEAFALRGKIAISNARLAYRRFREIFYGAPFVELRNRGARVQRLLWGSTGTKNPAYPDTYYVRELIGTDTVNTVPRATLAAFRDHGEAAATLDQGLKGAIDVQHRLAALGIALYPITEKLQDEGVQAFADSYDRLLTSLDEKCRRLKQGNHSVSR